MFGLYSLRRSTAASATKQPGDGFGASSSRPRRGFDRRPRAARAVRIDAGDAQHVREALKGQLSRPAAVRTLEGGRVAGASPRYELFVHARQPNTVPTSPK